MQSKEQYLALYREHRNLIASHSSEVMNALRDEACRHLEQSGFPTKRVEDYKYTDVESLFTPDYGVNIGRLDIPVNPYDVFKCDVPNMSTSLYFVVNDTFYNHALPKAALPEGVILGSLKELSAQYPELASRYYGQLARTEEDAITALNTMLAQDGLLLYVPKGGSGGETHTIGQHTACRCQLHGKPSRAHRRRGQCAGSYPCMRPHDR